MGQRIWIGNPDSGRPELSQRKVKWNYFMFEQFSVGLETSPGTWKYFLVGKKTTVYDLKQKFPVIKTLVLIRIRIQQQTRSGFSNFESETLYLTTYLTEGRKKRYSEFWKGSLYSKTGKRADNLLNLGLVHGLALLPLDPGEGGLQVSQPVQVLLITRSDK
jgi:hypothetical protein